MGRITNAFINSSKRKKTLDNAFADVNTIEEDDGEKREVSFDI